MIIPIYSTNDNYNRNLKGSDNVSNGWIKLHRKILDCFIWQDKPLDKARAWIDLLLLAVHNDKKMLIDGDVTVVNRGSFFTSRMKLADRWGWSVKKVDTYLNLLEKEGMITTIRAAKGTAITIVNYENYQFDGTTEDITQDTTEVTTEDIQNKNDKNIKNVKNNMCKKEAQELFEKLWQIYPVKKGKGQVSITAKQRLLKVGHEEMVRAIDRYKAELEKDSSWRKPQNGSTFFNSGYVDYLDTNYSPDKHRQAKNKNSFNDYSNQRSYNDDELENFFINEVNRMANSTEMKVKK